MKFDGCLNYQFCMCIYNEETQLSNEAKFNNILNELKNKFADCIDYDSEEALNYKVFKDLRTVQNFLHGGGLPFESRRILIKGLDLEFKDVPIKESGILLTVFPEFNAAEIQFCFEFKNASTDDLIYLRQIMCGAAKFYSKDGNGMCLMDWYTKIADAMNASATRISNTYLIEIKKTEPYMSAEDLLNNEAKRIYGIICGDEGWEFVPEKMAQERLKERWGSRDFVRFTVFGDNAILINLMDSEAGKNYIERQYEFGTKAYGGINEYFLVNSSVAGICHGILLSQEMVTVIRAIANRILNRKNEFGIETYFWIGKEIERTKGYRSELITTINKVENLGISEMGELEQLLLRSYNISPLIDSIKYLLELLESELDLLYNQSTNRLVTILTVIGLIISFVGVLSSLGVI